jgi:hypothetical protein
MKVKHKNSGVVMLITIFVVALLSAVVMGIMQLNRKEIQLVRDQIFAAQAIATAEAGLNNTFARIMTDDGWTDGFDGKVFDGGFYNVTVTGTLPNRTIISEATTSQGFVARVEVEVTVSTSGSDNIIRIDNLKVNE